MNMNHSNKQPLLDSSGNPEKELRYSNLNDINTSIKGKSPGIFKKIFCCYCFKKDQLITSASRKSTWAKLIGNLKKTAKKSVNRLLDNETKEEQNQNNQIIDPLKVLTHLYTENDNDSIDQLRRCRINPNLDPKNIIRDDLEFFIPQLCNFIVFHEEFKNVELNLFLQDVCQINFFFSHLVYWNLLSLSKVMLDNREEDFMQIIEEPLNCIINMCSEDSINKILLAYSEIIKMLEGKPKRSESVIKSEKVKNYIDYYGTINQCPISDIENIDIKASDVEMKNYRSIFQEEGDVSGFLSTIYFFQDLINVSDKIMNYTKEERVIVLKKELCKINQNLPAAVYIPFFKNNIRNYAVLSIVVEETVVFSTKKRAPFCISLEIFRPEEDYDHEITKLSTKKEKSCKDSQNSSRSEHDFKEIDIKLSKPLIMHTQKNINIQKNENPIKKPIGKRNSFLFRSNIEFPKQALLEDPRKFIPELRNEEEEKVHSQIGKSNRNKHLGTSFFYENANEERRSASNVDQYQDSCFEKNEESFKSSMLNLSINDYPPFNKKKVEENQIPTPVTVEVQPQEIKPNFNNFFPEDSNLQKERIKKKSPFRQLKSWNIIHLIIKTQDNLKQEQFALQLIYQFHQIFKAENLKLRLRPYEVLSLGPDCGVMEMLKDCVTIDALKKKIYNFNKNFRLVDFFQIYYGKHLEKAKKNFCYSLAAYSLICYLLQIKDRHNGNILLHRDGYVIHIDFGFLLSNMPGKGLEFEKPVPFKLISEYVEVLGGENSNMFRLFRKQFFQGLKAAIKHKEKILLLVKMMFSSHGNTLPCFEKGENCIKELEQRFHPPKWNDDGELNIFAQNLINMSLDNLRTKWYDKFQYYCQGIFY